MCMIAPILAQKGGEMLGMDIFGAQARKKKQDKKIQDYLTNYRNKTLYRP